jgi:hypothetical protein
MAPRTDPQTKRELIAAFFRGAIVNLGARSHRNGCHGSHAICRLQGRPTCRSALTHSPAGPDSGATRSGASGICTVGTDTSELPSCGNKGMCHGHRLDGPMNPPGDVGAPFSASSVTSFMPVLGAGDTPRPPGAATISASCHFARGRVGESTKLVLANRVSGPFIRATFLAQPVGTCSLGPIGIGRSPVPRGGPSRLSVGVAANTGEARSRQTPAKAPTRCRRPRVGRTGPGGRLDVVPRDRAVPSGSPNACARN